MSSSYCTLNPASHRTLIDIMYAWERTGNMCERFSLSGMPAMSRLHVCVDISFYPSGRLMGLGFLAGCKFFTGVTGRKKCPVALVSSMASCLDICIIDVEYSVSICLLVWFLMMIVLLSSSSLVASNANLFVVLFEVGYNKLTVVGSIFFLSILSNLVHVAPNRHHLHCCCCCCCWCCCFQVSCWSVTQFYFLSCCVRIHAFPDPEPSGRVLCCDFIEAPEILCA